jgi:hypothetical protein
MTVGLPREAAIKMLESTTKRERVTEAHIPGHPPHVATLAQKKGTVKDVQGVMRHSRVATTTDVYMQELPEGVRATVDSIHGKAGRRLRNGALTVNKSTQNNRSVVLQRGDGDD